MNLVVPLDVAIDRIASDWVIRCDGQLRADEEQQLAAWLAADPRHAAAFERLAGTWSAFERAGRKGATSAVLTELQGQVRKQRTRRIRITAAVMVILILPSLLMFNPWIGSMPSPVASFKPIQKLPDGSIVELNRGAAIAVRYDRNFRRVHLLRGEAHFRVEKEPARPFLVEAGNLVARAVGTAFTVQLQAAAVEIVVTSGRVAVDQAAGAAGAADPGGQPAADTPASAGDLRQTLVFVDAGSGVVIQTDASPIVPPAVKPMTAIEMGERLAWRLPQIEFDNTPLSDALARMNHQNRLQIAVDEPALGALRISGIFHADNPEGFVRILEGTFSLRSEYRREHEIVLRRAR